MSSLKCFNNKCENKNLKKSCHYCHAYYCSRTCRQLDWTYHKSILCPASRLASYCKKLLVKIGRNFELRHELSKIAYTAYTSFDSKGFVWLDFEDESSAYEFLLKPISQVKYMSNFLNFFGQNLLPKYVYANPGRLAESKILTQLFLNYISEEEIKAFTSLIQSYEATNEFVLLISIKLHDVNSTRIRPRRFTLDNRGFTYVFKYLRMDLKLEMKKTPKEELASSSTLILTSLNKTAKSKNDSKDRENRQLFLVNLLNEFQIRGINLREKYPKIYRDLCLYVDENRAFTPLCLFPRDLNRNNLFMCMIMPDSEPIAYESWVNMSSSFLDLKSDESNNELMQAQIRLSKYLQIE